MDALLDNRKRDEPRSRVQISMPPRLRKHLWRPEGSGQHSSPMPPRVAKLQTPEARGGAGEAQLVKMRRISVARSARGSAAPRLRRAVDRIMEEPFHTARFAARAARLAVSLSAASSGAVCRRRQGRC